MSVQTLTGGQIPNMPAGLRGATILVSPPVAVPKDPTLPLSSSNRILSRTATVQATGLTYAFASNTGDLNFNNVVGTRRADGTWITTPYASTVGAQFASSLANSAGKIAGDFTTTATNTVRSSLLSAGAPSDPTAVSNFLANGAQNGRSADQYQDFRTPGAGALPGRSGGEADVSGTRQQVADSLTSLSNLALTITGESAAGRSEAAANRKFKELLKYPESLPENMDYVQFSSKTYGNKNLDTTTFKPGERSSKDAQTEESVILPIQSAISDANTVGWNEETFNPAQIIGANLAISGITGGGSAFIGSLKEALDKSTKVSGAVEKAIIAYFTEQAIGTQVLSKVSGAVFNPNTELLFQGPQLRSFSFTFKLTPRSDSESKIVRQIIGFFKRNMAPQTEKSGLYLKAPKIFTIDYYYNGKKGHPGIGLIKDCALQACNVDYTPDGSYMSFEDGAMVSYNLSLQFMELEPVYAKDYDESNQFRNAKDHLIGY